MNVPSSWTTVVGALVKDPIYCDKILGVLEKRLSVDAKITPGNGVWHVSIVEGSGHSPFWNDFDKFYDSVEWAEKQLESWESVEKSGYNEWIFTDKKSAEKFRTLFSIQWPR